MELDNSIEHILRDVLFLCAGHGIHLGDESSPWGRSR